MSFTDETLDNTEMTLPAEVSGGVLVQLFISQQCEVVQICSGALLSTAATFITRRAGELPNIRGYGESTPSGMSRIAKCMHTGTATDLDIDVIIIKA